MVNHDDYDDDGDDDGGGGGGGDDECSVVSTHCLEYLSAELFEWIQNSMLTGEACSATLEEFRKDFQRQADSPVHLK